MDNVCLLINTNTKLKDIWPMFFGELEARFPQIKKKYIFVDNTDYNFGENYNVVFYDNNKQYRDQLLECFPQVTEKYCIYIQEDYLTKPPIHIEEEKEIMYILKLLQIKLAKNIVQDYFTIIMKKKEVCAIMILKLYLI